MDFKIVNYIGDVVATVTSACAARCIIQDARSEDNPHILLDDTGIEISEADLEILCLAEEVAVKPIA